MTLLGVTDVTKKDISETLEANLISFFDWGFVNLGGHVEVPLGSAGAYTNDFSVLRKVTDIRQSVNEVWQGIENWVYETGVTVGTILSPSIEINGVVSPPSSIDYRNGRVFVPAGATSVRAEYSYKWALFTSTKQNIDSLRFNAYDKRHDLQNANNQDTAEMVLPLPVVNFNVPSISSVGFYGLSKRFDKKILNFKLTADVFGERHADVNRICDIIAKQKGFYFDGFCLNDVCENDEEPLNYDGSIKSGKNHAQLAEAYPWTDIFFKNITTRSGKYIAPKLFQNVIDFEIQIINCGSAC